MCSGGSTCHGRRDFVRPRTSDRDDPVQFHRMVRLGRSSARDVDRRGSGPFAVPAFSASDPPLGPRRGDVARRRRAHDAAHPCAGDQSGAARHDGVVQGAFGFRKGATGRSSNRDLSSALRWYENTRRRKVKAVSWVTTQQVSRSESALRPAAMIPDRFMTWALTTFLRSVSHRRISAEISRDLGAATTSRSCLRMPVNASE